jgi:transposase
MKKHKPAHALNVVDIVRMLLRTKHEDRHIAASTRTSKTTVRRYRRLLAEQNITDWEAIADLQPEQLVDLFNKPAQRGPQKPLPDWAEVHVQMQRKHVTIQRLWTEYRKAIPDGLSYSHFADQYKQYVGRQPTNMRQHHAPGEKAEVDYSGDSLSYIDPVTRERRTPQLFVGVLPASSLLFATCLPSQRSPDFIEAIVRMLEYFGGAPIEIVSDNLKAGFLKPMPDPWAHPAFRDCCRYYGAEPSAVRPYHPRDKATVESSVGYVQREILGALRDETFHSLDELNAAITVKLEELNDRPMQLYKESRRARFERFERSTLRPLPAERYAYHEYVEIPRVPQDYHVEVHGHFYSVPHELIGQRVDARISRTTVEILHMRRLVARHRFSGELGHHTTAPEHQTPEHRHQATRSPDGMKVWAEQEGGHVQALAVEIFKRAFQPFAAVRSCEELRALIKKHGSEAVQKACGAAMEMKSPTVSSVKRCLAMDRSR